MLLILGGTTEGRKAVEVVEQAAVPYFYSTLTGEHDITLEHGTHVSGGMDAAALAAFCRKHEVTLMVDAAHPFATGLHRTVAAVAKEMTIPVVRYERIYPERNAAVTYVADMEAMLTLLLSMEEGTVVLSTLGVKSIGRLREVEQRCALWHRILPRESSLRMAESQGADATRLCFYQQPDDFPALLDRLRPQVLLLKESGTSGGSGEKVAEALRRGIKVIELCRPELPQAATLVNGPHGLRRAIEHYMPDFFPLHSGLTTGTCATAALVAALQRHLTGREEAAVPVVMPNGETISVEVGYTPSYAYVVKEHSDDPDVTRGVELRATFVADGDSTPEPNEERLIVALGGGEGLRVYAGLGIGRFTNPGFDYPPPAAAVNCVPRMMMQTNLLRMGGSSVSASMVISIPDGVSLAHRTFNPRLGIEGGISIIGVSGIVMPYSEEAFVESIRRQVHVARATAGTDHLVVGSGAKSEDALRRMFPDLPAAAFVQYGNYVGATLRMAADEGFRHVTVGIMMGKAVKLAAGELDTHSRRTTMNKAFLAQMLAEAEADVPASALESLTLARSLLDMLPQDKRKAFTQVVVNHCLKVCQPLLPEGEVSVVVVEG